MKKNIIILAIISLTAIVAGCDKADVYCSEYYYYKSPTVIEFVNNSNYAVSFFIPAKGENGLPSELNDWYKNSFYRVESHGSLSLDCMYDNVTSPVETYGVGETVPFYVFETRTLDENEWSKIVGDKMWIALYNYNATHILELGKCVKYPEENAGQK